MKSKFLLALVTGGLLAAVHVEAQLAYFQNTTGLISPADTITFSEVTPAPNTVITTQYQPYGVTFSPNVYYAPIYNQNFGTPNIDPTASVGNFIQFEPTLPTFSILFNTAVTSASFAVLSQPGTFQITPYLNGVALDTAQIFTGGLAASFTNNFVGVAGLSGIKFNQLLISNVNTSDHAFVFDNLSFNPVPEPTSTSLIAGGLVVGLAFCFFRKQRASLT
jgi:hypothetical protein